MRAMAVALRGGGGGILDILISVLGAVAVVFIALAYSR